MYLHANKKNFVALKERSYIEYELERGDFRLSFVFHDTYMYHAPNMRHT